MTISQAIKLLNDLRNQAGDVLVYFDCPKCGESFAPNKVVATAIHITQEKEKK